MMHIKMTLAAIVLAAVPGLAMAEGCGWKKMNESASSCPDGSELDTSTGACVKLTTS